MGWSEKRGKYWRSRWKGPSGKTESMSGFLTEKAADKYWQRQEADIDANRYVDPRAGQILFEAWANTWYPTLDLELSTLENYRYHLETWALPEFGDRSLAAIAASPEVVDSWELAIVAAGKSKRTAKDARATLATCLQAAIPHRIQTNPAERKRATGKKATRRVERRVHKKKAWENPLGVFLLGERAATLTGCASDFVKVISIAYTGMRWSEAIGLHPDLIREGAWDLDWKLYELNGRFYRQYPKDGSMRTIDIPPFLDELIAGHLQATGSTRCGCDPSTEEPYCRGGDFAFLTPGGKHPRRSDYARRVFRPAADGRYSAEGGRKPRPARPILADMSRSWPGTLVPVGVSGDERSGWVFGPSASRGLQRRPEALGVNSRSNRAALVAYAIEQGVSSGEAGAMSRERLLDRFVRGSYSPEDALWALWAPIRLGLTPHDLRRSHETWMAEDRIADKLRDERMGHVDEFEDPDHHRNMRTRYTEVSDTMRGELVDSLQKRWEQSLIERVELERAWAEQTGMAPSSPVPIVNEILKPYRERGVSGFRRPARRLQARHRGRLAGAETG